MALVGASCGGPVSVGQPLPVSGSSVSAATVVTCLDSSGRIELVADSTGTGPPSIFRVQIDDDTTGGEVFDAIPTPSGSNHFEGTSANFHGPTCMRVQIQGLCYPFDCSGGWIGGTQTFDYTVSLVP